MILPTDILSIIEKKKIRSIDFRFTDLGGKFLSLTYNAKKVDECMLSEGVDFYGRQFQTSSKEISGDMVLMPDLNSFMRDPFSSELKYFFICSIFFPNSKEEATLDPRSTATRLEEFLYSTEMIDKILVGPELEFYLLDSVVYDVSFHSSFHSINHTQYSETFIKDLSSLSERQTPNPVEENYEHGVLDLNGVVRSKIFNCLDNMKINVLKHHHESHTFQHEISLGTNTLLKACDEIQLSKYVAKCIANEQGKIASFMPKISENGDGVAMQLNISLWYKNTPIFYGNNYANLSDIALHFIGGIIEHRKALNALCNPSTVSYKRLASGRKGKPFSASFSKDNRTVAIRVINGKAPENMRLEIRFPDCTSNPYLASSAILMAGFDGMQRKLNPGEPCNQNMVHDLKNSSGNNLLQLASSLQEALDSLEADHKFLLVGDVFLKKQLLEYISKKRKEIDSFNKVIHPLEFKLYLSS